MKKLIFALSQQMSRVDSPSNHIKTLYHTNLDSYQLLFIYQSTFL